MLTEMIGNPWNPTPQPRDKVRGVHTTPDERLYGMFRAGEGAFAGMASKIPGNRGH